MDGHPTRGRLYGTDTAFMTYEQTIAYLYQRLPVFSRIGNAAIKKDLINIRHLCDYLGNPEKKFKCIHVAGTNGKGSTSHMLAAVLQSAGYRTGLYTSPHLTDFRERFRIDGTMIPAAYIRSFVERHQSQIEAIEPSFFEVTVAMAFSFFADEKVDIAVIETGLGGRLDSTNIILPELSVITNIGFDHTDILGHTLEAIATEKAGIIKPLIPVVVGEYVEETRRVFDLISANSQAPVTYASDVFTVTHVLPDHGQLIVQVLKKGATQTDTYALDLPGLYQTHNLLTVLAAVDRLRERQWRIPPAALLNGLQHTKALTGLAGRWEHISRDPDVIIDVAHNKEGIREVVRQLATLSFNHLHWVIGVVKEKDVDGMLSLLPPSATYYFTKARIPRAMDTTLLAEKARQVGLRGDCYAGVDSAVREAKKKAGKHDLILVCGSIFLAGELTR